MRVRGRAALLPLLACLLLGAQGPGILALGCVADEKDLWKSLLQASLEETPEARKLIERTAEDPPSKLLGKLAEVLLEESVLPPTAVELRHPRIVHAPKPDYADLFGSPIPRLKSSVVVAVGDVSPLGAVENVRLKIATGVEVIDQRCLEAFTNWKYRPARGEGGYVKSKVGATCHINLR